MKYWTVIVAVSVWPFSPRLLFHALGTHKQRFGEGACLITIASDEMNVTLYLMY